MNGTEITENDVGRGPIGFRGSELEMRTRLFVGFHSMESALHSDLTEAKKKTHLRLRHALLTRR